MFVGNAIGYNRLLRWLSEPLAPKQMFDLKCMCIVNGPSGVGKTWGIIRAIEDLGLVVQKVDDTNVKQSIVKIASCDIISQFLSVPLAKQVIFIDDLEMYTSVDRCFMNSILSLVNTIPAVKVVLAASCIDSKLLEKIQSIRLFPVPESDIIIFLRERFRDLDSASIYNIVQTCQGNLGAAIHTANCKMSVKDKSPTLCDLYTITDASVIAQLIQIDPWLIPLRYHENILQHIKQRKGTIKQKNGVYTNFLEQLCEWDILHSHAKKRGDIESIYAEALISHSIQATNSLEHKKYCKKEIEGVNNFTKLFNSLSLRKKRKIANSKSSFPWDTLPGFWKELDSTKHKNRKKTFLEEV